MAKATNLGFPYMGPNRELKKQVEAFWAGGVTEDLLLSCGKALREENWKVQVAQGIEHVPVGEFTYYDRVLDVAYDFGVVPKKYEGLQPGFEQYFAMARGLQRPEAGIDVPASEMKKWFDTNYHFIVPEFKRNQEFALKRTRIVDQLKEAQALGIPARPVLLGPVSFLYLGKLASDEDKTPFDTIDLLPKLLPVYDELIAALKAAGAEWIQVDEPILVFDFLTEKVKQAFRQAYQHFADISKSTADSPVKILLATYFGRVDASNLSLVSDLVEGVHLDLTRGNGADKQLASALTVLTKPGQILSLGLVDGRNVWKNNFAKSLELAEEAVKALGVQRVWVGPSCSLMHSPFSVLAEKKIAQNNPDLYDSLSFAVEKCKEVAIIAKALSSGKSAVAQELEANANSIERRRLSKETLDPAVRARVAQIPESFYRRSSPFATRREVQVKKLQLPLFPTTTIGSFPQTKEIRIARQKYAKLGAEGKEEYDSFIKKEIERVVRFQEEIGLDVLVHGEPERNDMVEHFGHLLHGYGFTQNGWVVSYGSRCVKPPIVYGDVSRRRPMTIEEISYAQSLTKKPMKGMLTGPVTMLKWSFIRDDIPTSDLCKQVALALRDETVDLEAAGIPCIQVDEPAIREGLPLRHKDWEEYLEWSVACFRLSTSGVRDETQIHTHMCYSDFNEIFDAIQALDADAITIENSRSDMKLLKIFESKQYSNEIGPGLYDIHSPRVPSVEEMASRFENMLRYIPSHLLWANPDCGLKSRGWKEVDAALRNMVAVARAFRVKYDHHQQTS